MSLIEEYTTAWRQFARLAHDPKINPSAARLRDYMRTLLAAELEAV